MNLKYCFTIVLLSIGVLSYAQDVDSLFAVRKGPNLALRHFSKPGESISMLSKRFYESQEKIESLSGIDGRRKLETGTMLFIPMSKENFMAAREPVGVDHREPVYYRVGERDDLALISMYAGARKQDIILWNTLKGVKLAEGQVLFIGWMKMVPRDSINMANGLAWPTMRRKAAPSDTSKHAFGELDSLYNIQTKDGTNVLTEKGTAVFFEKAGKNNIYYAFHNTSQRNAIIKVTNPGTGKVIYAKVLGPIPDTKLYANCIIGISSGAKEALGVTDTKAWCELSYSPY